MVKFIIISVILLVGSVYGYLWLKQAVHNHFADFRKQVYESQMEQNKRW